MTPDVKPLVAGNWKMNGLRASLDQIKAMAEGVKGDLSDKVETLICPPATLLYVATALCDDSPLLIGAQDCHEKVSGAHTGDVSAEMIADCFGTHVIVGHSERRTDHKETDAVVRAKAEAAYDAELIAIICIGETGDERKAGQTLDVLKRQLAGSIPETATAENTVIAYEPVWAIGTGPDADRCRCRGSTRVPALRARRTLWPGRREDAHSLWRFGQAGQCEGIDGCCQCRWRPDWRRKLESRRLPRHLPGV